MKLSLSPLGHSFSFWKAKAFNFCIKLFLEYIIMIRQVYSVRWYFISNIPVNIENTAYSSSSFHYILIFPITCCLIEREMEFKTMVNLYNIGPRKSCLGHVPVQLFFFFNNLFNISKYLKLFKKYLERLCDIWKINKSSNFWHFLMPYLKLESFIHFKVNVYGMALYIHVHAHIWIIWWMGCKHQV